mgnify:CR=1 FL=1
MKYFITNEEVSQNVWNAYQDILILNAKYQQSLSLIAAPMRPDGTWNRNRFVCYKLAKSTLES